MEGFVNRKTKTLSAAVGGTLALGLILATGAQAQERAQRVKAGSLNCDISSGIGLIIGSKKSVACVYTPTEGGRIEGYTGSISKFGLDIGATAGGQMVWAVYAPSAPGPNALAGNYVGASAEATAGAGLGANVLVGGSNRTVALQPLSLQGQAGINLAVGVSELALNPGRLVPAR
jgi:hypothetical protein